MPDEIQPALTPEEWAAVERERAEGAEALGKDGKPLTGLGIGYETGWLPTGDLCNPFTPHQLIALLNSALPDDDPRKITREDVALIRGERFGGFANDGIGLWNAMGALAAKLAAFLPPNA